MVDWISLSIAIISLFSSLSISIVSLIISWKGLQLGFGAFLSIEEINGETVIKNLGEALAHNLSIHLIDQKGNHFIRLKSISFINKNEEKKINFTDEIIDYNYLLNFNKKTKTRVKPNKFTEVSLVKITYTDIHGRRKTIYFESFAIKDLIPRVYTIITKKEFLKKINKLREKTNKK